MVHDLMMSGTQVPYAGREPSAATATGYAGIHKQQQAKLVNEALDLDFKSSEKEFTTTR